MSWYEFSHIDWVLPSTIDTTGSAKPVSKSIDGSKLNCFIRVVIFLRVRVVHDAEERSKFDADGSINDKVSLRLDIYACFALQLSSFVTHLVYVHTHLGAIHAYRLGSYLSGCLETGIH